MFPPIPPFGFAIRKPLRGSFGVCKQQTLPTPVPPAMAGLRWDRWNQRSDGTHFGDPRGVALWGRRDVGRVTALGGGRQLNTESSPTALPASQSVTKQQTEGVFVFDQRALRHIGLYTAKPFPQRIESDQ
jgi:hypothetical protein